MNRRTFLQSSLATAGVAGLSLSAKAAEKSSGSAAELYELRRYSVQTGPMSQRLEAYLRDAAIPALRRAGTGPVGVFTTMIGQSSPDLLVLIPYPDPEVFTGSRARLKTDAEYQAKAETFLAPPKESPSYLRVSSTLLAAIEGMPRLVVPSAGPRIFELRTYESHSDRCAELKVAMFNDAEIALFHRAGHRPVFFGSSLVGERQPNLSYLLCFESMAAREKAWAAFGADPDWKKLRVDPRYGGEVDAVSNISNEILRPAAFSQI